jgi:catechol-2,3-dioxygenase
MGVMARLACVHLFVHDLERARHFYTHCLGLRISREHKAACYLSSGPADHELALFEYAPEGPRPPLAIGCRSIGFEVPSKGALAAVCDRLRSARVTAMDNGATWSLHTTDPDGNHIKVFCQSTPRPQPGENQVRTLSAVDLYAARNEVLA